MVSNFLRIGLICYLATAAVAPNHSYARATPGAKCLNLLGKAMQAVTTPIRVTQNFWARLSMPPHMKSFDQPRFQSILSDLTTARIDELTIRHHSPIEAKAALIAHIEQQTIPQPSPIATSLELGSDYKTKLLLTSIEKLFGKKPLNPHKTQKLLAKIFALSHTNPIALTNQLGAGAEDLQRELITYKIHETIGRSGIAAHLKRLELELSVPTNMQRLRHNSAKAAGVILWAVANIPALLTGVPQYLPKLDLLKHKLSQPEMQLQIALHGIDSIYPDLVSALGASAKLDRYWSIIRMAYNKMMAAVLIGYVYSASNEEKQQRASERKQLDQERKEIQKKVEQQVKAAEEVTRTLVGKSIDDMAQEIAKAMREDYESDDDPKLKARQAILEKSLRDAQNDNFPN